MQYHPDKNRGENKPAFYNDKFLQVNAAYEVLGDEQRKLIYDGERARYLRSSTPAHPPPAASTTAPRARWQKSRNQTSATTEKVRAEARRKAEAQARAAAANAYAQSQAKPKPKPRATGVWEEWTESSENLNQGWQEKEKEKQNKYANTAWGSMPPSPDSPPDSTSGFRSSAKPGSRWKEYASFTDNYPGKKKFSRANTYSFESNYSAKFNAGNAGRARAQPTWDETPWELDSDEEGVESADEDEEEEEEEEEEVTFNGRKGRSSSVNNAYTPLFADDDTETRAYAMEPDSWLFNEPHVKDSLASEAEYAQNKAEWGSETGWAEFH